MAVAVSAEKDTDELLHAEVCVDRYLISAGTTMAVAVSAEEDT